MTDVDRSYFCIHCGAKLHENDEFCPSCGGSARGESNNSGVKMTNTQSGVSKNYLIIAIVMLAIWAAFAAYTGISSSFNIDFIIETLKSDPTMWSEITSMITESELRNTLLWVGYIFLASAAFSVISLIFCVVKKYFIIALIACILAVITSMVFAIIGILVIYLIYKAKPLFTN